MPRSIADAALAYAGRGIGLLPLYSIKDGRCTCGRDCGRDAGKHPNIVLVPNGVTDASCDPEQVGRWFRACPESNIGIRLGELAAIDEDQAGAIVAAGLELPNCPVSKTGRGHHYILRTNGQSLENGRFAPGLDCKVGNAYIVAPPSWHISGGRYAWLPGHSLEDLDPPLLPEAVERLIVAAHLKSNGSAGDGTHNLRGLLEFEKVFDQLADAEKAGDGDRWRKLVLKLILSLVGRGTRDDLIVSFCRRATWIARGWTHQQTDQFVIAEIRRTRAKFDQPDEDTFNKVDGQTEQPVGIAGSTVEPKHTDWLWWPYFPAGELSLLGAKGGVGKGQACASVVATITTGRFWPDGSAKAPTGHVLWAEAEDSIDKTVIPRLIANRADLDRVTFFNEAEFGRLDLRQFVDEHNAYAIVLSPMLSFLPKLASHNDELKVREKLLKLRNAIDGTLCALIGIAHLNKKTDLDAVERLLGSVAFSNFVRSVILLATDKERDDMRRLVHAKFNLSLKGSDLLFRTVHVGENPRDQFVKVEWETPTGDNVDVDSFFDRRKAGDKPSAHDWVVSYLREHGSGLASEIMTAAIAAGYSDEAVRKAQYRSKTILSRKDGFHGGWVWELT